MTFEESLALAADVADPDFLPRYAALLERERLLRGLMGTWRSARSLDEWTTLERCRAQVLALLTPPVVLPSLTPQKDS